MADKIEITILGTSSAVPTAERNHPSFLLHYKDQNILFDCGEGTQRQIRKVGLNPCKINKIFISHWHGDHILGIPGLLQTLAMNGYNKVLEIYGPRGTKEKMQAILDLFMKNYFKYFENLGFKLELKINEVKQGVVIENQEWVVMAENTEHWGNSLAYSFLVKEKQRLDKEKLKALKIPNTPLIGELVLGKKVKIDGKIVDGKKLIYTENSKKITYISDTSFNENLIEFAKDSDVIISECSYLVDQQEKADNYFHLTTKGTATIAKKAKAKKLYLLHLSQQYSKIPKVVENEAKKFFSEVEVLKDFDKIKI